MNEYTTISRRDPAMVRANRRPLTDPEEIRAYRRRHLRIIRGMLWDNIKAAAATVAKQYHRVVAEFTFICAILSIWIASIGILGFGAKCFAKALGWE